MKQRGWWRRRAVQVAALGVVAGVAVGGTASADIDDSSPIQTFHVGEVPAEARAVYDDCPTLDMFPDDITLQELDYCIVITAYDGELKIGNTVASVRDPIRVTLGVAVRGFLGEAVIVPAEGGGAPRETVISGGILGQPALDPLLEVDHKLLQLVSLGATPMIGEVSAGRPGQDARGAGEDLLWWMSGVQSNYPVLGIPLSIKLNNTLLGPNCTIPEFRVNLSYGPSVVPPGVTPMEGESVQAHDDWWLSHPQNEDGSFHEETVVHGVSTTRTGNLFVDNGFAVPSSSCGGVANVGGLLGRLIRINPVQTLVNQQAGLPSPAGNNYVRFRIDTALTSYHQSDGMGMADAGT